MRHKAKSPVIPKIDTEKDSVDRHCRLEAATSPVGQQQGTPPHVNLCAVPYYPLVAAGKLVGLSKSTMYRLIGTGMLDAFHVGSKRFVYTESLRSLPERLERRARESALEPMVDASEANMAINDRLVRASGSKVP